MVVIAIIGILAAFAYPSYRDHVIKSRRADAQNALMTAASDMEKYFWSNMKYTKDMTDIGYDAEPAASPEGYYEISAAEGNTGNIATSYILTARPTAADHQTDDSECTTLTLDSTGEKGSTPGTGKCWGN
jgi:type IV pilus assembly protein PilE